MIIFECTKKDFCEYVKAGVISNKVYHAYKVKKGKKTKLSQIKAWGNSLPYINELIQELPGNTGIAIEFGIPYTSKSIDLVISGYNENNEPIIIIMELKQWQYARVVNNEDAMVRTTIGSSEKNTLHPSYQTLSYMELLKNYNSYIERSNVQIIPLVYLHNYELDEYDALYSKKYRPYYQKVSLYGKDSEQDLKKLISKHIKRGDNLRLIHNIANSEIKPTKRLLEVINNIILSRKEFTLLDEQKIIMERIITSARSSFITNKKQVIIVKGGPGTGKSILALVSLGELLKMGLIGAYVSKNMAPRKVYKSLIATQNEEACVHELFKTSGYFFRDNANKYDFLLIDEAHRLQEKSGLHNNIGENQIKEIINASKLSVFFVDEKQFVTLKDIGTISNIKHFARLAASKISILELNSQFRCNGSDDYLGFIDALLYNKRTKPSFNFALEVVDTPNMLRNIIITKNTHNNARIVAGFCWPRNGRFADDQSYPDIIINDFKMSWNLKHGEEFATRLSAINEVGCIYNVQGLEFDYIGVIIGPDLKYEDGLIKTDYTKRANTEKSLYGLRIKMKEDKDFYLNKADEIIRNTYRVLLTRGIKGCYIYACDNNLQKYLKKLIKSKKL